MTPGDDDIAAHLESVKIKRPADVIIEQLSILMASGVLKPGQRLPSERVLAERFQVGRAHIREAIHKLELYGIVNTLPQSGTFIEQIGVQTLQHLIGAVLGMDELTPQMLTEVRGVLEVFAAEAATERATPEQLGEIRKVYEEQVAQTEAGEDPLEADALFHIRLADATNNVLLRSLINLMRRDVMRFAKTHRTIERGRPKEAMEEHRLILEALERRSAEDAGLAMRHHIQKSREQYHVR